MRAIAEAMGASVSHGSKVRGGQESPLLRDFKARNPHINPDWDLRHYLVVVENDVVDVIAAGQPRISERNDSVRGWIRPGEKRSG